MAEGCVTASAVDAYEMVELGVLEFEDEVKKEDEE